ncbi:MAG: GTP 3',8-cyclase MoaA [Anaerolineae bacterium]|nr:GTP 3',8-cyclase MoaA [Anaerolineae bacterium]
MRDAFGRSITYLRLSVTDRCNLRCLYCMPEEGVPLKRHDHILRYEEIVRLVRLGAELGITKVRVTGGEPLVRPGVVQLVRMLSDIPGLADIALTTNGILLAQHARGLAEAGLKRVNVSLDTLRPERFQRIARRGRLQDVLDGLEAARSAGLSPIKVNMVVIRGLNDDEVVDFARLSISEGWHVRFIEVMPLGEGEHWTHDGFVPASEMRARIEAELGPLAPLPSDRSGPARTYRLHDAPGTVGLITPVTEHFCGTCNRLRLSADGRLVACLLRGGELDVRGPLRRGATDDELRALLLQAVALKPAGHRLAQGEPLPARSMSGIGG